jgi:hypothetical protein
MSQSLFNLTTALNVSGVTITHLQEHKTTATTASGNRYTVLLFAAIVEEFSLEYPVSYTLPFELLTQTFNSRNFLFYIHNTIQQIEEVSPTPAVQFPLLASNSGRTPNSPSTLAI